MKILLLTEDYYPNIDGGALVRSRFTELIEQTPHELTVITGQTDETPLEEEYHGARIIRPVNPAPNDIQGYEFAGLVYRIMFSLSVFVVGLKILYRGEIDIIYSKSYSTHWAAKLLSVLFRRPLLTFIGGTPSLGTYKSSRIKLIPEWINLRLFMGDFVFTRTRQTSRRVTRISGKPTKVLHGVLNKQRIHQTVAGCNPQNVRDAYDLGDSDYLMVFVGRLVPLKNPVKAVDVLSRLPSNYTLVLIGSGPEETTLQNHIKSLGLNDRVHLTGQLPHQEALRIIYSGDIQLITSKIEAYPSVVFEGLALNNEVFTKDIGIVTEISEDSLHVTDDFAKSILSTDIDRRYDVNERVLDEYSIERYTDESISMMERLVADS